MKKNLYLILITIFLFCGCGKEESLTSIKNIESLDNLETITNLSELNTKVDDNKEIIENTDIININEENEENIEEIKTKEITISFAGDFTIGTYKGQGTSGTYNEYYDKFGGDYFLKNVRSVFESDDITFVNLEGPITDRLTTVDKKFPISCRSEHINVINNSSIEVCGLSNNHTMDCGIDGFNDTINILEQNNIGFCGEGNIYRKDIDGIIVSCLAYNGWSDSQDLLNKIENDILNEKENGSNIICVMFHWGIERDHYNNEIQQKIAYHTIDCGADIVVGAHPHVIQGIESYKDKTIVYSLGNFTFGANKNPSDKDTFIFQQTFNITDSIVEYGDYNIIPCSISSEKNINNYQPIILDGENAERVLNRLKEYSKNYNNIF